MSAYGIYSVLATDDVLTDLVQVYRYSDLPAEGINREDFPQAYTSIGILRPMVVVKGRGSIPTRDVHDAGDQYTTTRQVVELWMYNDRAAGWATLHLAADRIYALLHDRQVANSFQVLLVNEIDDERDPDIGDACMLKREYQVIGFKRPNEEV